MAEQPDMSLAFDCADCGLHVISIVPPHNPARRCAGCQWLADLPAEVPEAERAALRRHMLNIDAIGSGEDAP